jgi:hypothetical protein
MRRALVFEAERTGYNIGQLFEGNSWNEPMTVGELMGILEDYDEDDVVVLSHDRGYTYGGLGEQSGWSENADGEWEKDW